MADFQLSHAKEFTAIEDVTLAVWDALLKLGYYRMAARLLNAGLLYEHYTSLLPSNPAERSDQQNSQQERLAEKFVDLVERGIDILRSENYPPPGIPRFTR